jgi:hypothetical protein
MIVPAPRAEGTTAVVDAGTPASAPRAFDNTASNCVVVAAPALAVGGQHWDSRVALRAWTPAIARWHLSDRPSTVVP